MVDSSFKKGFSLLELLIVILIIGICSSFGIQLYRQEAIKAHRTVAKRALLQLASQLEHYYQDQFSYKGATLEKLNLLPETESGYYGLSLVRLEKTNYFIQANPLGIQTNDLECGAFGLDQMGRKFITGRGVTNECWK